MNRLNKVSKAYNNNKLSMDDQQYMDRTRSFLNKEIYEDLQGMGLWTQKTDITTKALFTQSKTAESYIKAKQDGVIAGLEEMKQFYQDNNLKVTFYKKDGDTVKSGDKVLELKGDARDMLNTERTGLNLLQRMSGIATTTKNLSDKIKKYDTQIAATRKSQNRFLDKRAVKLGGGLPHRLGLHDGIMIKDTHLDALKREGIENAIEESLDRAGKYIQNPNIKFVEIEVQNQEETIKAATKFKEISDKEKPCIIMLDNMKPKEIKQTIIKLKKLNLYDYVLLEASGMITEKNIESYAKSGVDVVSLGCLTHSVKSLDLSQKMEVK